MLIAIYLRGNKDPGEWERSSWLSSARAHVQALITRLGDTEPPHVFLPTSDKWSARHTATESLNVYQGLTRRCVEPSRSSPSAWRPQARWLGVAGCQQVPRALLTSPAIHLDPLSTWICHEPVQVFRHGGTPPSVSRFPRRLSGHSRRRLGHSSKVGPRCLALWEPDGLGLISSTSYSWMGLGHTA